MNARRACRRGLAPFAAALLAAACAPPPTAATPLARTVAWLAAQQGEDGRWRSQAYAVLARGESTTAAVALALLRLPEPERTAARPLVDRALAALAARNAPAAATPPEPVDYPVYTAAYFLHALALRQPDGWRARADALVAFLRRMQLGPGHGWPEAVPEFGAFGLGDREPKHPLGGDLVGTSTLAAVLEALAAAGVAKDDEMLQRARVFVERCQQYGGAAGDGGFHFAPTRDWRASKAGFEAEADGSGERPRSYGSATADGVRALLALGDGPDAPRVRAGLAWLAANATRTVPGMQYANDPTLEPSLRLTWLASLAAVAAAVPQHPDAAAWRELARSEALALQAADGRFVGLASAMKEDDPLVATILALFAHGEPTR